MTLRCYQSFFFNGTAHTGIYTYGHTLSLHDALPISCAVLAYDTDALAGIDHKIGAVQQHLGATAQCQTGSANHEASCSLVSIRIWFSVFSVLSQTDRKSARLNSSH